MAVKDRGGAASAAAARKKSTAKGRAAKTRGRSRTRPRKPPANGPGAAGSAAGLRVRMFRVGFGDFFVLTVPAAGGPQHILIDCGVHAGDIKTIDEAVTQMAADTGGKLALVIMTHRHADHISGFARCKDTFARFQVGRVWMPWFENRTDPVAVSFQANLTAVAARLGRALAARTDKDAGELADMAENITGGMLGVGGSVGGGNDVALKVLHGGFANSAPVDYYKAGDPATLPQELIDAGLQAQILGPPIDPALVKQMDNKNHQYLAADESSDDEPIMPFTRGFYAAAADYPQDAFKARTPQEIEKSIAESQPDLLAARARQADNTLNNQSLVVLFSFHGKTLLFAGDAQWGNWENFLFGGAFGTPGHTGLTEQAKAVLGAVDFYKVGHHGSTNATPMDALQAMRDGCVAMCSTEPGCYGTAKKGTEVPRQPLLAALDQKTAHHLVRSDQIPAGKAPATRGLGPVPAVFQVSPSGALYVDYLF